MCCLYLFCPTVQNIQIIHLQLNLIPAFSRKASQYTSFYFVYFDKSLFSSLLFQSDHLSTHPACEGEGEEDEGRGQEGQHRPEDLQHTAAPPSSICRQQRQQGG